MKHISLKIWTLGSLCMIGQLLASSAEACTRIVYKGKDNSIITGRSMDWKEDMKSDLWVFPRGMDRDGAAGEKSLRWTSKYGSLITAGYNVGSADGMNEKGLVGNLLYLTESDYGAIDLNKDTPILSISLWLQYALDNFETVAEAVEALRKEPFQLSAPVLPNGSPAQLHLSLSDPTGDSAIFEYIDKKLVIHHSQKYTVMTNSPKYEDQLALNEYWEEIGGLTFLPGTNRAADRFVRASFLVNSIPKDIANQYIDSVPGKSFQNQAIASVISVMRSVSVPLGITTPDKPNIASSIWRTIADQKNKIYFFDSAVRPNTFWVPFSDLDFTKGAPVKKLSMANEEVYAGNASAHFKEATPFEFLPATGTTPEN